jgi:OPA family sugar phosphate sensor protein UhpC-like MFS transporter
LIAGFLLFGFGINGLITSLGGLFAVDISPKRAAGAVMGFVGVFSYLGAGLQEQISGMLIQHGMKTVHGVRSFNFGPAIYFWCGAAVVSLVLASIVWNAKPRE